VGWSWVLSWLDKAEEAIACGTPLRDAEVVERTLAILEGRGHTYETLVSAQVGRGVKERYAFLWRPDKVVQLDDGVAGWCRTQGQTDAHEETPPQRCRRRFWMDGCGYDVLRRVLTKYPPAINWRV